MEKYFEINKDGHNVRCKIYYDKNTPIKKVVLCGHGFAGHKDGTAVNKFADRVLTKYKGIAIVTFNLPCHGDDVKKKLTLQDCLTYIDIVLNYVKEDLKAEAVYVYSTSFGGYLALKYISEYGNPFAKLVLRCPAVNMAEVLLNSIMKRDEIDELRKGKTVQVGFDRKIDVSQSFLDELEEADIRKLDFSEFMDDILILHGTKDEVVSYAESKHFADENLIEFISVEHADHRFQNPACMEAATKATLAFFEF